jgi:hypothetical protein
MRRAALRSSALALAAVLLSTGAAWAMALWSPLHASRRLEEAEAGAILTRALGAVTFHGPPAGVRQWGFGFAFELASSAPMRPPPFEPPSAAPARASVTFQRVPSGPEDLSVQRLAAGWPLACMEGWVTLRESQRQERWLANPPDSARRLGAQPYRSIPLCPRPLALAANAGVLAAAFWCAVPGPRLLRRRLRRARGRCAGCGYDLAHLGQPLCPECGAAR